MNPDRRGFMSREIITLAYLVNHRTRFAEVFFFFLISNRYPQSEAGLNVPQKSAQYSRERGMERAPRIIVDVERDYENSYTMFTEY